MSSPSITDATSAYPFERVRRAFEEAGGRHLVIDGQAAGAYGVSQFTLDADLWVEPTARNWPGAQAALRATARPAALLAARNASLPAIQAALDEEKAKYQQANLDYWSPLLQQRRRLRHSTLRPKRLGGQN